MVGPGRKAGQRASPELAQDMPSVSFQLLEPIDLA